MYDTTKTLAELAGPFLAHSTAQGDCPRNRLNAALRKFAADRQHAPVNSAVLAEMLYTINQTSDISLSNSEAATIALIVEFAATLTLADVQKYRL